MKYYVFTQGGKWYAASSLEYNRYLAEKLVGNEKFSPELRNFTTAKQICEVIRSLDGKAIMVKSPVGRGNGSSK